MRKKDIDIITLGCSKNLVDSERLMGMLKAAGFNPNHDPAAPKAKIAVINTCGFIGDAKEESTLACGGKCDECVGGVCAANRSLLAIDADDKKASQGENIASRLKAFPEGTDKGDASDKAKGGDRA